MLAIFTAVTQIVESTASDPTQGVPRRAREWPLLPEPAMPIWLLQHMGHILDDMRGVLAKIFVIALRALSRFRQGRGHQGFERRTG
jgi:hypothetical protein